MPDGAAASPTVGSAVPGRWRGHALITWSEASEFPERPGEGAGVAEGDQGELAGGEVAGAGGVDVADGQGGDVGEEAVRVGGGQAAGVASGPLRCAAAGARAADPAGLVMPGVRAAGHLGELTTYFAHARHDHRCVPWWRASTVSHQPATGRGISAAIWPVAQGSGKSPGSGNPPAADGPRGAGLGVGCGSGGGPAGQPQHARFAGHHDGPAEQVQHRQGRRQLQDRGGQVRPPGS
jgi:hypothetical protein